MSTHRKGARFRLGLRECNGALGDTGTLVPLTLGAISVSGLAPTPVLLGFALFYIATALYYRLPMPVQPMKAMVAVLLTTGMAPEQIAAGGVMVGLALLVLGCTGWIARLGRAIPQSVLTGLQLGLGMALALMSIDLMASAPLIASATLLALAACLFSERYPAVLIGLAVATALAHMLGHSGTLAGVETSAGLVAIASWPSVGALREAFSTLVLPQLALTLTNAVLLTALLAGEYYGDRADHVTPARLSVTSGLANLLLAPLGALPMCHGAGGVAAHYRFGARTGTAPLLIGLILLALALAPYGAGTALLTAVPAAGLGALLLVTAGELMLTRRLFDSKPSCWPVIAVTAAVTIAADPFWGLLAGVGAEPVRAGLVRRLGGKARL
ncbi:putative sulfate/molybdate transporter [Aquisalimonas lutea]|uniref:putative sulfate/molybdate transporter n=1 Tax=Aquisalimonas lutea TaxID=1327750 RepID=UPI0025B61C72|nr:putative sulfate/molybdate transporter [Aquisalimonas lutea]MDN3519517.1 putative sulfate/molybdate transporter [Aquisalimonas lutea]